MAALFVGNQFAVQILEVLGIGAVLVILGCPLLDSLLDLLDRFSRLDLACKVVVLFFVVQLTMFGGAKHGTNDVDDVTGTNDVELVEGDDTNGVEGIVLNAPQPMFNGAAFPVGCGPLGTAAPTVVDPDVVRGYRLASVCTNDDISYAMPADGTVHGTWHLTGAYEDVMQVGIWEQRTGTGGWSFPLGNNFCTSLWAYTWGKVRPQLKNASNEIAAVGAPMSAIPGVSRFWTAGTPNDSYLMTWENFAVGRVGKAEVDSLQAVGRPLPPLVNAQIELHGNGGFVTRSNGVESVWRRVNPDDWDDDGIPNEDDPEPLCRAEDETRFGPHQTVPEGDDTNHYCWVDVVVRTANARVTFEGEGGSWLPDPTFIAEANATNRVMILIGKTYAVHCGMPVEIVGKSDEEIETWTSGGVLMIEWPVWFEYVSVERPRLMASPLLGTSPDDEKATIQVHPLRMGGGVYGWEDDFCCYSFAADGAPVFNCNGCCGCGGGCYTGEVTYECSGHEFSFGGWSCSCVDLVDDDPQRPPAGPSISADFSAKAIVFEDAYMNAPGQFAGGRSTDSEVTCSAYGGTNGISYSFTIEGADDKLRRIGGARFPMTGTLAAGESFLRRVKYDAIAPSTNVEDIVVHAEYTENGTGSTGSTDEKITAVKVKVEATASFPSNKVRHVFGPNEIFNIVTTPSVYGRNLCEAPLEEGGSNIALNVVDVNYSVDISVVHPSPVIRGEKIRDMTAGDWRDINKDPLYSNVPGAGFVARWYLQPDYVSFEWINVCEGVAPMSGEWGCFTDAVNYPPEQYEHSTTAGAERVSEIASGNVVTSLDRVGVQLGVPPTSDGGFSLVIPWSWGGKNEECTRHFGALQQTVSVASNGVTTISKGGLSTTRGVNL